MFVTKIYNLSDSFDGCPDMVSVCYDDSIQGEQIADFIEINAFEADELYFCAFSEYGTVSDFCDPVKLEQIVNMASLDGKGYSTGSYTYEQMDRFIENDNDPQSSELWSAFFDKYYPYAKD